MKRKSTSKSAFESWFAEQFGPAPKLGVSLADLEHAVNAARLALAIAEQDETFRREWIARRDAAREAWCVAKRRP